MGKIIGEGITIVSDLGGNLIVNIIKSHINVIMGMIILKKSIQSAMEH